MDAVRGLAMPVYTATKGDRWVIYSDVDERDRWWIRATDGIKWYQTQVTDAVLQDQLKRTRTMATTIYDHFYKHLWQGMFDVKVTQGVCYVGVADGYAFQLTEVPAEQALLLGRDFIFKVAAACAKRSAKIMPDALTIDELRLQPNYAMSLSQSPGDASSASPVAVAPAPDIFVAPGKRLMSTRPTHTAKRKAGTSIINPWTKGTHQSSKPAFEDDDNDG